MTHDPKITMDRYLDEWLGWTAVAKDKATRLPDGWILGGRTWLASPCSCGESYCDGWKMNLVPERVA